MSKRLRKGDQVLVIAGNSKGKTGKVLAKTKKRVIVEGVNFKKKHMKRTEENPQGQIAEYEHPFNISNVVPCDDSGKRLKLKVSFAKDGAKELVDQNGGVFRTLGKGK